MADSVEIACRCLQQLMIREVTNRDDWILCRCGVMMTCVIGKPYANGIFRLKIFHLEVITSRVDPVDQRMKN